MPPATTEFHFYQNWEQEDQVACKLIEREEHGEYFSVVVWAGHHDLHFDLVLTQRGYMFCSLIWGQADFTEMFSIFFPSD